MSSKRSKTDALRSPENPATATPTAAGRIGAQPVAHTAPTDGWERTIRESIESVVVAFVLAFLFRTFEAEAFVIPTGSMAPTLQGRHKDLVCPECGLGYRVGASGEVDDEIQGMQNRLRDPRLEPGERDALRRKIKGKELVEGTCPNCRFPMEIDPDSSEGRKWPAYNGDRILVAKFPYDFADPKRWDVVVFRYPGNGQMNYIKRLVGLPRETVMIEQGDIHVKKADQPQFEIVHKPASKVWAMAQLVYNNDYVVDTLTTAGWPLRWQPMGPAGAQAWESSDGGRSYAIAAGEEEGWIRYQHFTPNDHDWQELERQGHFARTPLPHLITDFYAYNTGEQRDRLGDGGNAGLHWVGDLMLEATLETHGEQGTVALDLVKGGRHFRCNFELASGQASLSIDGVPGFAPQAQTALRGAGSHRVAFANVDQQLLLWVDGRLAKFSVPTTYDDLENDLPTVDDLAPAGIAARGAAIKAEHLLLKRDVYYIAARRSTFDPPMSDYDFPGANGWGVDRVAEFSPSPTAGRPTVCSPGGAMSSFPWTPTSFSCWGTTARPAKTAGCGPTPAIPSTMSAASC